MSAPGTPRTLLADLAMPIALGGGGLFVIFQAQGIATASGYSPVGPSFFPTVTGALMLLIAPLLGFSTWRSHTAQAHAALPLPRIHALGWLLAAVALGALGIERAGFVPAMIVAFVLAAQAFPSHSTTASDATSSNGRSSRTLLGDFGVAIVFALTTWFLFTVGLGLRLPAGWLSALPGA